RLRAGAVLALADDHLRVPARHLRAVAGADPQGPADARSVGPEPARRPDPDPTGRRARRQAHRRVTKRQAWTRALLVVGVVLVVDQVSKAIIRGQIVRGDSVEVLPFLDLVNTRNNGIAFGQFGGSWLVMVLVLAALVGIVVVFDRNATRKWAWLTTGLLLGGA